jgi:hypothetical protein
MTVPGRASSGLALTQSQRSISYSIVVMRAQFTGRLGATAPARGHRRRGLLGYTIVLTSCHSFLKPSHSLNETKRFDAGKMLTYFSFNFIV